MKSVSFLTLMALAVFCPSAHALDIQFMEPSSLWTPQQTFIGPTPAEVMSLMERIRKEGNPGAHDVSMNFNFEPVLMMTRRGSKSFGFVITNAYLSVRQIENPDGKPVGGKHGGHNDFLWLRFGVRDAQTGEYAGVVEATIKTNPIENAAFARVMAERRVVNELPNDLPWFFSLKEPILKVLARVSDLD